MSRLLEKKRQLSREVLMPSTTPGDEAELFRDTVNGDTLKDGVAKLGSEADSLDEVDRMTPYQFENWVLRRFATQGWHVNRTPMTRDGGADGVLTDLCGNNAIVQVKHRTSGAKCGDEPINDLINARKRFEMPTARLYAVTNARSYTASALERAARHGIITIAKSGLMRLPRT
ncbi:restriction system protein [Gammaproteobacteria bacterium]